MKLNLTDKEVEAILVVLAMWNGNKVEFNATFLKYSLQAARLKVIREGDTIVLTTTKGEGLK